MAEDRLATAARADGDRAAAAVPPGDAAPGLDALLPPAMAGKAAQIGAAKAAMPTLQILVLAVLAGAFIALGAMFATTVTAGAGHALPFGVTRLLAGIVFSLGLILVVVGGAELFTGNNLIVMAWAERRVTLRALLRNWGLVYVGNLIGALATVAILLVARQYEFGEGAVGASALQIAQAKSSLDFGQAVALGVMCNALVCLAIWLTYSARTLTDKVVAILFPISAFVALGFEHSVANMYFLPIGLLIHRDAPDSFWTDIGQAPADFPDVNLSNAIVHNLIPVTVGNVIGGAVMVGLVYWLVYLRGTRTD